MLPASRYVCRTVKNEKVVQLLLRKNLELDNLPILSDFVSFSLPHPHPFPPSLLPLTAGMWPCVPLPLLSQLPHREVVRTKDRLSIYVLFPL